MTALSSNLWAACRIIRSDATTYSDMSLHKMLYFAQGYTLAWLGRPAFDEQIIVGATGPKVEAIFDYAAAHDLDAGTDINAGIDSFGDEASRHSFDDPMVERCVAQMADQLGRQPSWSLREMAENHWCVDQTPRGEICTRESMAAMFTQQMLVDEISRSLRSGSRPPVEKIEDLLAEAR